MGAQRPNGLSVVGDFNGWDGRCHPMRVHGTAFGVWELFVPGLAARHPVQVQRRLRQPGTGQVFLKTVRYGRAFASSRPGTAAIVAGPPREAWTDAAWLEAPSGLGRTGRHTAMSIYEVHLGSWQRGAPDGETLGYRELARRLTAYRTGSGFTHVELMPVSEHPFDCPGGIRSPATTPPPAVRHPGRLPRLGRHSTSMASGSS